MSFPLPIHGTFDLIVVGGATGGVAAALTAYGRRVYLGAQESYLGEDICSTGRLCFPEGCELTTPLSKKIFDKPVVRPLAVKGELESALLDSGAVFEFGVVPVALLKDGKGLAGVVFSGKGGAFAVLGRSVLDVTPAAQVARLAKVEFTPWPEDAVVTVSRVQLAPPAEKGDLSDEIARFTVPNAGTDDWALFRTSFDLPMGRLSPALVANAENNLRSSTWKTGMGWGAPRVAWQPQDAIAGGPFPYGTGDTVSLDAFRTSLPGLFVLGPCAALSRADAAKLCRAPDAMAAGARLGQLFEASGAIAPDDCIVLGDAAIDPYRHELPRDFHDRPRETIELDGLPALPSLGQVDVVVIGGGTGGAPAALAAARAGAKVLLLESQHELGGVGTLGAIAVYWFGNREGFTAEVTKGLAAMAATPEDFHEWGWNALHKSEWFRREITKAGGSIWFGAVATGALRKGKSLRGVTVSTPWGYGSVEATVVIDATGSADIAAAAGCECTSIAEDNLAIQGCGLPPAPIPPHYYNSDYTFIDDNDPADVTRAMVVARRRFQEDFDLSPIPGTRERRQIVGDVVVSPLDVFADRPWSDTICRSVSDFDSHGYTLHPIFHVQPPQRGFAYKANLPLRALLPKGTTGLLVTGLGISGDRDAMPIFRMQADIQNHSYAAGLAAKMALEKKGEVRRIDVRSLQRALIAGGNLPPAVLIQYDLPLPPRPILQSAANGPLTDHVEIAALMAAPETSRLFLHQRFTTATDAAVRLPCAKLLAVLGNNAGASLLVDHIAAAEGWDEGWNFTGMGQGGASESELDACIQVLAYARIGEGRDAVLAKIRQLGGDPAFSHLRAVCVYAETFRAPEFAKALSAVLLAEGMHGHDWQTLPDELADIPADRNDTSTRNRSLRELCLAKAIYLCGDCDQIGEKTLRRYTGDVRGYFSKFASKTLALRAKPAGR